MRIHKYVGGIVVLAFGLCASTAMAQVGVFDQTVDWGQQGTAHAEGSATVTGSGASAVYTVKGNGNDIWGQNDEGFYVYKEMSGSFSIQAKVDWVNTGGSLTGGNEWAKAGVMIRDKAAEAGSRHYSFIVRGMEDQLDVQQRPEQPGNSKGAEIQTEANAKIPAPDGGVWLRVSRVTPENVFTAEYSLDGSTWNYVHSSSIPMGETVAFGLAVTNHLDNDQLGEASFSDVAISAIADKTKFVGGPLGIFEGHLDVGDFNINGDASFSGGEYTVSGSGADVWGSDDDMHFVYKQMSGNFEAQGDILITGVGDATWTKAGLMVRQSLDWLSPFAWGMVRSDADFQVAGRTTYNGGAADRPLVDAPNHQDRFKVVRIGNIVNGYYLDAADQWVLAGSFDAGLTQDPVYFGLAITSHNVTMIAEAVFSNLQITEYDWGVTRSIPVANFIGGQAIVGMNLNVDVRDGKTVGSLTITETLPKGTNASNLVPSTGSASVQNGAIVWSLSNVNADATLSYDLSTPVSTDIFTPIVTLTFSATAKDGAGLEQPVTGQTSVSTVPPTFVKAWEAFSYPDDVFTAAPNKTGDSIVGGRGGIDSTDNRGAGGWTTAWTANGAGAAVVLDEQQADTARIIHQTAADAPGSFSAKLNDGGDGGIGRSFPKVSQGELWISYVYMETGPATEHWSGMTLFNEAGNAEQNFVGKPWNAGFLGIGNLPGGDKLTNIPYNTSHHIVVRYSLDSAAGQNDDVYMWVDPDENDDLSTYDAGGQDIDNITEIGQLRLRRGGGKGGNAWYDDIQVSSNPSLRRKGDVLVDLGFQPDSPVRSQAGVVLHDVISIDKFIDATTGAGYGHDNGQNHFLVVQGNIYYAADGTSRIARGVPIDRMSGLNGFIMGPYNDSSLDPDPTSGPKNSLRFNTTNGTALVELDVPDGKYEIVKSLSTTGNGSATLTAVFTYDDGTSVNGVIRAPDWFDDNPDDGDGGTSAADLLIVNNHMNRLDASVNFDGYNPIANNNGNRDDPGMFDDRVALDPNKTLTRITLGPTSGGALNLYGLILEGLQDVSTSVNTWMVY